MEQVIGTIFTIFSHVMYLCQILAILAIFQISHYYTCYGDLGSVIFEVIIIA